VLFVPGVDIPTCILAPAPVDEREEPYARLPSEMGIPNILCDPFGDGRDSFPAEWICHAKMSVFVALEDFPDTPKIKADFLSR
jgi:hypothetical protein